MFIFKHFFDLPKTIWINFKTLKFKQAIFLPLLISRKVRVKEVYRNSFEIPKNAKTFSIKIGTEGADGVAHNQRGCIVIHKNSKFVFKGKASISRGILIRSSGCISFGNNFYCNSNLSLICDKNITFGDDCLLGWNIHIRDCDGHSIYQNGERINQSDEVIIGNHVWVGQDVKILKGAKIPDGCVVAMNSCVTKKFEDLDTVIGGYPAKVIKTNIGWEV